MTANQKAALGIMAARWERERHLLISADLKVKYAFYRYVDYVGMKGSYSCWGEVVL